MVALFLYSDIWELLIIQNFDILTFLLILYLVNFSLSLEYFNKTLFSEKFALAVFKFPINFILSSFASGQREK